MRITISTQAHQNGDIALVQKLEDDLSFLHNRFLHEVIRTKDEQTAAALKQLGWTSPAEKAEIRVRALLEVQRMMNDTPAMMVAGKLQEMIDAKPRD